MKYTLDQLELIAIMFKIQFGDKTFKEIFPDLKYSRHEGTINELTINHNDGDVNFVSNRSYFAFIDPITNTFMVLNGNEDVNYYTKIENIVKMLNFEDKI